MAEPAAARLTWAEYIAHDRAADVRHEYVDGRAWAMAGGSPTHAQLAGNALAELRAATRGGPCRVFTSDLRIRVERSGDAYYPDATVVCRDLRLDPDDDHTVLNPSVLVEVLSPTTERYDRGHKLSAYRQIDALGDYVLVSQAAHHIEHFRRNADGSWTLRDLGPGDTLALSVGAEVAGDSIYEDVAL